MQFVRVCAASDLEPSACREFRAANRRVLICEYRGSYYAHSTICPHQGNSLDGARLYDGAIECPWHHYEFDVVTGENRYPSRSYPPGVLEALAAPVPPLHTYPLQRRGDDIYVAFPERTAVEE